MLIDYIEEHYPNAKLCDVVDLYKKMEWRGYDTKHISEVNNLNRKYVFVTAMAAVNDALKRLSDLGVDINKISFYKTQGI